MAAVASVAPVFADLVGQDEAVATLRAAVRPRRRAATRSYAARPSRRGDDPRVDLHRTAGIRPVGRRAGVRRRIAVPAGRVRRVRRVPHHARRHPRRRPVRSCPRDCPSGSARCGRWCCGRRAHRSAAAGRSCSSRTPTGSPRRPATRCSRRSRSRSPRTVFLLCTPSTHPDDISVTIRSRCRVVTLRTPRAEAIAANALAAATAYRTDAAWAAAAAQGHVGRARRLARDPQDARARREAVLAVPRRLTGIGACFDAAAGADRGVEAEAATAVSDVDTKERPGAGDRARRRRDRSGRGRRVPGRRRRAQGAGTPAEVAGHPGPAGRARPGSGRPGRLLPRRAGA